MGRITRLLALASFGQFFVAVQGNNAAIQVSGTPPANATAPLLEAFVSYSIEFSSFPDFAGTLPDIMQANTNRARKYFITKHFLQQSSEQSGKPHWD